jgi:alanyl-tRNA synthetase
LLDTIQSTLKVSANIEKSIQDLLDKQDQLTAELDQFKKAAAGKVKQDIIANLEERGGVHFVAQEVELDPSAIKDLAFQLKAEHAPFLGVFGSRAGGKTTISIAISDDLVADRGMHAGNMVRELAKEIGGGGGGQPFFATAGGKNPDGLSAALKKAAAYLA